MTNSTCYLLRGLVATGLLCPAASAQLFQETYHRDRFHDHYAVQDSADGFGHVVAGTVFNVNEGDHSDMHLMRLDEDGQMLWDQVYDTGLYERCLSFDQTFDGYVLAGFVDQGVNTACLIRTDSDGNLVSAVLYEDQVFGVHSQLLHVEHTPVDDGFIAAGFVNTGYDPTDEKLALVVKTDPGGNPIWDRYFDSSSMGVDYNMAGKVEVIPGHGYFVTGSTNAPVEDGGGNQIGTWQGALALLLDDSGATVWESSFGSQSFAFANDFEVGIDSYYDAATDEIYLLTNNSELHLCAVTVLDAGSGAVNRTFDFGPFGVNYIGQSILPSADPTKLVVSGMIRSASFLALDPFGVPTSYSGNSPPFLVEIDKGSGAIGWSFFYPIPSAGYRGYGGFFGPFSQGQQGWIFSPDAAALTDDGNIVLAAYRSNLTPQIDLEIAKVSGKGESICADVPLLLTTQPRQRFPLDPVVPIAPGLPPCSVPFETLFNATEWFRCGMF